MEDSQSTWTKEQWRAYALLLEKTHQRALDGWATSVDELGQHTELLRRYIAITASLIDQVNNPTYNDASATATVKKKRGRPKQDTPHFTDLDFFESMKSDYLAKHPGSAPSDKEVIEWSVAQNLVKFGLRASRVREPDVQASIKTLRNRISDARNPVLSKKSR